MRRCPTCEEEIDEHLEVCPWCGRKTGFKAERWTDRLLMLTHRPLIYYILAGVALLSMVVGLAVGCNNRPTLLGGHNKQGVSEVIDSFIDVMPQGSQIVARFHDNRHCLYYLNTGHLMKFNAASKMLDEIDINQLDDDAHIYYNDRDDITGITEAKLSEDEKFIILTAVSGRSKDSPDFKTVSFKLNTESMNLLPYSYVPPKAQKAPADSTRRYKRRYEAQPADITSIQEASAEATSEPKQQPVETTLEEQPVAAPPPPAPATAPPAE